MLGRQDNSAGPSMIIRSPQPTPLWGLFLNKKIMKTFVTCFGILLASLAFAQGTGEIKGVITDGNSGEPMPFAKVILKKDGQMIQGQHSDFDGNYHFKAIAPGSYDLEVTSIGFETQLTTGVVVNADKITFFDSRMMDAVKCICVCTFYPSTTVINHPAVPQ